MSEKFDWSSLKIFHVARRKFWCAENWASGLAKYFERAEISPRRGSRRFWNTDVAKDTRKLWISRILGAKRLRKVRIAEIFAGKVLLEAIFGVRFGGVGALVILPGKMWGKCGANPGQILGQNVGQNLWQSHDSSRRPNPGNPWKSLKMIKFEIVFLFLHLASSVVLHWKIDHFGRVEVSRLAGAWLAGRAC